MLLGGIEVQVPGKEIGRAFGIAVQEPEQAESSRKNERSLGRLEQGDGAQRGSARVLNRGQSRIFLLRGFSSRTM